MMHQRRSFRDKYLALLLITGLMLFAGVGNAQSDGVYQTLNTYGYQYKRIEIDSAFSIPNDTLPPPLSKRNNHHLTGKDGVLYLWTPDSTHGNLGYYVLASTGTVATTDSTIFSTRAWRDKLKDSLLAVLQSKLPAGTTAQYWDATGALRTFSTSVTAVTNPLYAPTSHTHTFSNISDGTTAVRNLFSPGSGISYNPSTGVIAATGSTSVAWGDITGDINNQTDLISLLAGYVEAEEDPVVSAITGIVKSDGTTVSAAIAGTDYVAPNAAITGATKTKITYDAKGLVTSGDNATTTDISEGSNLYFTDARARDAISLTTTGTSGAATYSSVTGILNIPDYGAGVFDGKISSLTAATAANDINNGNHTQNWRWNTLTGTGLSITSSSTSATAVLANIDLSAGVAGSRTLQVNNGASDGGFGIWANAYGGNGTGVFGQNNSTGKGVHGKNLFGGYAGYFEHTGSSGGAALYATANTASDVALLIATGKIKFTGLAEATGTKTLRYDPTTDEVTYHDIPSGGGMVYPGAGIAVSTGSAWGTSITDNSTNWNTAYDDRMKWDGGSTGLVAATGRTSLGATTVGSNLFTLTNNATSAKWLRVNADNTISYRTAAETLSDIAAQPQLNGTGFVKATGTTISYDNSTYLTSVNNANWSGTDLSVANGGTGASTLTGVLIGDGTNPISGVTGTANQLLRRNAGNTAYEFFTPTYLTANQSITLSGAVSGTGTTAITTTLGTNVVANSNIRQSAALSVIGRSANSTGDVADISAGSDGQVLRRSGTTLGFGTIATAGITDDAVTYAKMQNVSATSRLMGRITFGAGDMEELTGTQATTLLDVFTTTLKGLVPASGGGTTNFLRADGTWAAPPGGGGSGTVTDFVFTDGNGFDGTVTTSTSTPTLSLTTTVTDDQIMFSNSGAIAGSANLTWDGTLLTTTGKQRILNTTGSNAHDWLLIEGNTSANSNYPGIAFKGGNLNVQFPAYIQLGNGGLELQIFSPFGTSDIGALDYSGIKLQGSSAGGSRLEFYTSNVEKARLNGGGELQIGSTTDRGAFSLQNNGDFWNSGTVTIAEQAAPATPATGYGVMYPKTDGKLYWKDDAGTEYDLTATAAPGSGITSLGVSGSGQTGSTQTLAVGTSGSDFNISSASDVHTFNLPDASPSARGAVTTGDQTFAGIKAFNTNPFFKGGTWWESNTSMDAPPSADQVRLYNDAGVFKYINGSSTVFTLATTGDLANFITASSTNTLTNKTIDLTDNTVTGTLAELNTAISDADVASLAGTETLTNKRITKRVNTAASSASLTINSDATDLYTVTALAEAMTINAPSGTPSGGQTLLIRIKDNGTARALTWNAAFRAIDVTLPTTTVISKTHYIGAIWNATDSVWDVLTVMQQQ